MRALLLATAVLSWTATASAQVDERAARAHFASGRSYYDQARYEEALREFEEALRTSPDASKGLMIFNIAQVQERLGRIDEAIASFRRYLEMVPRADDRAEVEDRITNLRARLQDTGIVLTVAQEGARVSVDGQEVGTTPLTQPIPVTPGSHEVVVDKEGFQPFRLRVSVDAGRRVEAEATLVAAAAPVAPRHAPTPPPAVRPRPAPAAAASGGSRGPLPWVIGGVGVAALATGTVLGLVAIGRSNDANDETEGDFDTYESARKNAKTLAAVADVSFGIGLAGVATSVVLLILRGGDGAEGDRPETAWRAAPVASADGIRLLLTRGF